MSNKHAERIRNGAETVVVLSFIGAVVSIVLGILAFVGLQMYKYSQFSLKLIIGLTALFVVVYVLGVLEEQVSDDT